jgi:hypothetical protein
MKGPERLAESSGDELERAVLRAAKRDAPPAGDRERFLASLGLGAGITAVASPAAGLAAATLAKTSGFSMIAKWVGIGVVVGLVSGGAVLQISDRSQPPASKTPASAPVAPFAPPPPAPLPTSVANEAPPPPEPELPKATPPSRPERPRPAASNALAVDHEVAVLDRARNDLRAGKSSSALDALDEHSRRFPDGVLAHEAQVLRMEALAKDDPKAAAALARAFLSKHPESPHAKRVRGLLDRLDAPPDQK